MPKRTSVAILIACLLAVISARLYFAAPDIGLTLPANTTTGIVATVDLGIEEPIGLLTTTQAGTSTTYTDGNYQIQVIQNSNKTRTILRVIAKKISGAAFRMNGFSITVRAPRNSIQGIWYPSAEGNSTSVMVTDGNHPFHDIADANYGIPYVGAASGASKNVMALGLLRQDLAVSIDGQPGDRFYDLQIRALTARTATTFDERFYISNDASMSWFDIATNYSNWVDTVNKYVPFPISDRAYEPLYDAWYWANDQVDDRLYKDTAKIASDLGVGLYLADSGWDTDAGEYDKWLTGKTGDYSPPPSKFTNLQETFSEIRTQDHLGIDLWLQPFAIGRQSSRYAGTRLQHIQLPQRRYPSLGWSGLDYAPFVLPLGDNLEDVNLCPRMNATETYLKNLFAEMATKYNPDGYWLDFIDGMPTYCVAGHTHNQALFGDGFRRSLEAIKSTILTYNPQAIVHFRARYANLNNKSYANVWQSGDSPGDFDKMRVNSIRLHPFSKGVVFAADQMYWPDGISEEEAARFIMTSVMTGVPAFGPSLINSSPETLAMMKAWIAFYRSNKMDIAAGKFSPFGELRMPNHKIEGQDRTFAYFRNLNFSELVANGKTVFLMNATDGDQLAGKVRVPAGSTNYYATVLNRFLVPEPQMMRISVDDKNVLTIRLAVEQGGMVILTPQVDSPETESPATHATGEFRSTN